MKCGEEVPADSLLLSSSNDSGIAYVNTAQLDGESNLKPKVQIMPKDDFMLTTELLKQQLQGFKGKVEVPQPTSQMNIFNGNLIIDESVTHFTI